MRLAVVGLLVACTSGHPALPPPPSDAAASCAFERVPHQGIYTSTIWLDATNRPFRIDGIDFDANGNEFAAAYYVTYDDQGRVADARTPEGDVHYDYAPDRVTTTDPYGGSFMDLVDGRVVHYEEPLSIAADQRNIADYEYDAAGRIAHYSGQTRYDDGTGKGTMLSYFDDQYTYDDHDRIVSIVRGSATTSFAYQETADELAIVITPDIDPPSQLAYDFDASHRVVRAQLDSAVVTYNYDGDTITGTFEGGETVYARGTCDAPLPRITLDSPLPVKWDAGRVELPEVETWQLLY